MLNFLKLLVLSKKQRKKIKKVKNMKNKKKIIFMLITSLQDFHCKFNYEKMIYFGIRTFLSIFIKNKKI